MFQVPKQKQLQLRKINLAALQDQKRATALGQFIGETVANIIVQHARNPGA